MKTLALAVEKLLTRFKFSKSRPNSKVKVTGSKYFGTNGKEYPCEISKQNDRQKKTNTPRFAQVFHQRRSC